jgi:hypothetical protein
MNQELTCRFPWLDWKQALNIALIVALLLPFMALHLQPSISEPAVYGLPPLNWTSANWGSANWSGDCWANHQPIPGPLAQLERNRGSFGTAPQLSGERFCAQ